MACTLKATAYYHSHPGLDRFLSNHEGSRHLWSKIVDAKGTSNVGYSKFHHLFLLHLEKSERRELRRCSIAKFDHRVRFHHFPDDFQFDPRPHRVVVLALDSWIWCDRVGYNAKLVYCSTGIFPIPSSGLIFRWTAVHVRDLGYHNVDQLLHQLETTSVNEG